WRVLAITVGCEPGGGVKPGMTAGDDVKDGCAGNCAQDLGNDVGKQIANREAPTDDEADRDGRVQVAAGNVANCKCHREHGKTKGQRHPDEADTEGWESCR